MSLQVIEGWDTSTQFGDTGWTVAGANLSIGATGRTGINRARIATDTSSLANYSRTLASPHATVVIGFALQSTGSGISYISKVFGDAGATLHGEVRHNTNGSFTALNGPGGTLGTSAANALPFNGWGYVEIKWVLHDTTGSVEIRVNGVTVLNLTNIDTKNGGTVASYDKVTFGPTAAVAQCTFLTDDIYILTGAGTMNNDFLGDSRVRSLIPTGNGASSGMTGSDGNSTDNYLLVDDVPPNTADYVGSAVVDTQDTYAMTDLAETTGIVAGVSHRILATKTDSGARSIAQVTRSGGVDYVASDNVLTLGSYLSFENLRELDPATGVAWTRAGVNAVEQGARVRP